MICTKQKAVYFESTVFGEEEFILTEVWNICITPVHSILSLLHLSVLQKRPLLVLCKTYPPKVYVLLTVHLGTIFVNNQLDAQLFFPYIYLYSVHASGSHVPIIGRINCINTSSICHSV